MVHRVLKVPNGGTNEGGEVSELGRAHLHEDNLEILTYRHKYSLIMTM